MSDAPVRIHIHDSTATVVMNRPGKRNALSRELLAELAQAFSDLHQERRVRAVILTGSGPAFCAGMDLGEMLDVAGTPEAYATWQNDALAYRDLVQQMLIFPKPIIAAVNGAALAGGAGLLLASDIVVAAEGASFGLPEPRRGIVAGLVAPLLAFRVGAGPAGYLMLTAAPIFASEALRLHLFHEVVHPDHLWPRAKEIGTACAESAPEAIQLTKRMLNETVGEHLNTLLTAGAAVSATSRTTEAAREGLAAFREKRAPQWV
ncbi:MAG: enoyl-CoA hydratase/isomerase family protein [Pirellulales bacterium]|nr:enoyl-CoA hydratase/isomerase family protein [Pirellulales bacterium]